MAEGEAGYGYPTDEVKHHIRFHRGCNELLSGLLLSTLDSFEDNLFLFQLNCLLVFTGGGCVVGAGASFQAFSIVSGVNCMGDFLYSGFSLTYALSWILLPLNS